MAVTIHDQPSTGSMHPGYNPIESLVSGSNYTGINYKMYCKLFRDPASDNENVANLKYDAYPGTTGKSLINLSKLVTDYVSASIASKESQALGVTNETTFYEYFKPMFQEYYSTTAADAPTLQGSPSSGNTVTVWNGSYRYQEWVMDSGLFNWSAIGANVGVETYDRIWLTRFDNQTANNGAQGATVNLGNRKVIRSDQEETVYWRTGTNIDAIVVRFYDEDLVQTYSGILNALNTSVQKVCSFNVTPSTIDSKTWTVKTGTAPTSTSKYMIVYYSSGFQNSTSLLYEIDWSPCDRYTNFELHWENSFGGIDTWNFDKRSYQSDENDVGRYSKVYNPISGTSIVHTSSAEKRGQYKADRTGVYRVNTSILQDWENEGLSDLLTSGYVFWNSPDYGYVQIEITANNFEYKKQVNDKNYNLNIEFKILDQDTRQKS